MTPYFLILFALLASASASSADNWHIKITGTGTPMNAEAKKPSFTFEQAASQQGEKSFLQNTCRSIPEKNDILTELTELDSGFFKRYTLTQKQTGENGFIERIGDKLHFSYTREGKTKTSDEDFDPLFTPPMLVPNLIQRNWDALMRGDSVSMRLGVADRLETVGFKLFKVEESKVGGAPVMVVKMKPTSFVIAAIVDPLLFYFDLKSKEMLRLQGRVFVKQKKGDRWADLDADVLYEIH